MFCGSQYLMPPPQPLRQSCHRLSRLRFPTWACGFSALQTRPIKRKRRTAGSVRWRCGRCGRVVWLAATFLPLPLLLFPFALPFPFGFFVSAGLGLGLARPTAATTNRAGGLTGATTGGFCGLVGVCLAAPSVGEDEGDGRGLGCLLGVAGAAPWPLAPLPLALALATADAVSAIVPERAAVPGVLRLAAADIADLRKRRGLCQYSVMV